MKEHPNSDHIFEDSWHYQGWQIIDCQTCGFKHIFPLPEPEDTNQFYQEKYYRDIKPFPYDRYTSEQIEKTKGRILSNSLFSEIFDRVLTLKKTPIQNMLDIGCGNNLLSLYFQLNNWKANIIEPNNDAAAFLRKFNLKVYCNPVEEIEKFELNNLSFINMQFVLEHIRQPREVLIKMNKILTPGGLIRICVPNDFSEGQIAYQQYYEEKSHWVCLPDHINYFSFESLERLLCSVGFKVIYRTTNFPLEFLLMGGINYYANIEEQSRVRPFVTNFENSLLKTGRGDLLKQLYENLAQLGFGRSIFMYAIKEVN